MKYVSECGYVNGAEVTGIYSEETASPEITNLDHKLFDSYDELLEACDAVYLAPRPEKRYEMARKALLAGKHVLCKSPIALSGDQCRELFKIAEDKHLILMDAIKTAYSTAYNRLRLLVKSGKIGKVISISANCTSLAEGKDIGDFRYQWNTIQSWGPIAMMPVFQMLGTDYTDVRYICRKNENRPNIDAFLEMDFLYPSATANIKLGNEVKSESDLIVAGTKGYIYVPSPWWKTDYFEIRYEDLRNVKKYFYNYDGEGLRYMIYAFLHIIHGTESSIRHTRAEILRSTAILEQFHKGDHTVIPM
jgi:choline-phosphate cytidylyltransferase